MATAGKTVSFHGSMTQGTRLGGHDSHKIIYERAAAENNEQTLPRTNIMRDKLKKSNSHLRIKQR